ncbi:MAG: hypothetical protein AAF383_06680 [Cyanobacteria bacterium P01_A01_bin.83]
MFKTFSIVSLSLLLSTVAINLFEPKRAHSQTAQNLAREKRIDAFSLVYAAYRGQLKDLGVPAYARLDQAYRGRQFTAVDLVEAAIEANQLAPNALQDRGYIKAVELSLNGLVTR